MRNLLCSLLSTVALLAYGEKTHLQYLYPAFYNGRVLMKDSTVHNRLLNYNAVTQEMVFIENNKKLAIANTSDVDTVYILNHKFIPAGKQFYEVAWKDSFSLLISYAARIETIGAQGPYGTNSQSITNITIEKLRDVVGSYYELQLPESFFISLETTYWITDQHSYLEKANSEKQIVRLFPDKADLIKSYIKQQKINTASQPDMQKLMAYINSIVK
jgi:hypothetical protein